MSGSAAHSTATTLRAETSPSPPASAATVRERLSAAVPRSPSTVSALGAVAGLGEQRGQVRRGLGAGRQHDQPLPRTEVPPDQIQVPADHAEHAVRSRRPSPSGHGPARPRRRPDGSVRHRRRAARSAWCRCRRPAGRRWPAPPSADLAALQEPGQRRPQRARPGQPLGRAHLSGNQVQVAPATDQDLGGADHRAAPPRPARTSPAAGTPTTSSRGVDATTTLAVDAPESSGRANEQHDVVWEDRRRRQVRNPGQIWSGPATVKPSVSRRSGQSEHPCRSPPVPAVTPTTAGVDTREEASTDRAYLPVLRRRRLRRHGPRLGADLDLTRGRRGAGARREGDGEVDDGARARRRAARSARRRRAAASPAIRPIPTRPARTDRTPTPSPSVGRPGWSSCRSAPPRTG